MDISISFADVYTSTIRWFIGLLVGTLSGTFLAVLLHEFKIMRNFFSLPMNFLRALPIIALVPVFQLLFGPGGELGKFLLIAWSTMFPAWIAIDSSLNTRFKEIEKVLSCYELSWSDKFSVYTFPRIISGLIQGVQVGIGIGWLSVVAAELIGEYQSGFWSAGLGYFVMDANNLNNQLDIYLSLLLFGFLGLTTSKAWELASKRIFSSCAEGYNYTEWSKNG